MMRGYTTPHSKGSLIRALLMLSLFLAWPACWETASSQPLTAQHLISNAREYDGKPVVFEGEVIGDIMRRGAYAWVNINDGTSAIGAWVPQPLLADILMTGSYRGVGDWIEVGGVFNRACPQHGGDLDIHVQGLKKLRAGRDTAARLNPEKKKQVLILLGVLAVVWILTLLKRT